MKNIFFFLFIVSSIHLAYGQVDRTQHSQQSVPVLTINSDNSKRNYYDHLIERTFELTNLDYFHYYACPPFDPEYTLICSNVEEPMLVLKKARKTIYHNKALYGETFGTKDDYIYLPGKKRLPRRLRPEVLQLNVSEELCLAVYSMVLNLTTDKDLGCAGLDATRYHFQANAHDAVCFDKETWSPEKGTRMGRAVDIMERLCQAVAEDDRKAAEQLLDEIKTLAEEWQNAADNKQNAVDNEQNAVPARDTNQYKQSLYRLKELWESKGIAGDNNSIRTSGIPAQVVRDAAPRSA